jgi:ATP-binding cassette, subfamily B, bacterial
MSVEFAAVKQYKTDKRSPVRYVRSHILRHKLVLTMLLLGAFMNAALASVVPLLIGEAFNVISDPGDDPLPQILLLVLLVVASQFGRSVVQLIRNFSSETFAQRIERDVRDELYGSLLGKSMTFHDMQPVGEIMARVTNDVREMNLMMNPGLNLVLGSGMFLLMPALGAPFIHPALLLIPVTFIVLYIIVQTRYILTLHPLAERVRTSFGKMNARLAEALDGLQVVKGSAQEASEAQRFNKLADNVKDYYIAQGEVEARYLANLLLGLVFPAGFVHALLLYNQGIINIGDIVAFMGQLYLFQFPVFVSIFALSRVATGIASGGRILEIINTETDLDQNPDGHKATIKGAITFEHVSFGYEAGKQVVHDISFDVQPGQTVAIVGQTGAGKSSITKLMNRTYDVQQGRVLVDGVDVREWNLESLRSQISVIEQDIFLFSRTIAENISFADDDANREQVVDAAKQAQAHDFIEKLPNGYDTVIGQRGVTLSGGQRQRLALARAFQSDPPILILDDSTSAIDSATEDRIQQAIWTAAEGRTTILITHRLSQIRWADHIVVLRNGRVVAQGAHEDLLASSEAYRRIFARYDDGDTDRSQQNTNAEPITTSNAGD